jgi:hypothetical protein
MDATTEYLPSTREPFAVSRATAARLLDVSTDHIDVLIQRGHLERVMLGIRKVGITWKSLKRLVGEEAAA